MQGYAPDIKPPRNMPLEIVWRRTAQRDLYERYDWIAERADPDTAFAWTSGIEAHVAKLSNFPDRGSPREDIAPGVRTLNYRGRTVIAYLTGKRVEILRVFHAGRELGLGVWE